MVLMLWWAKGSAWEGAAHVWDARTQEELLAKYHFLQLLHYSRERGKKYMSWVIFRVIE